VAQLAARQKPRARELRKALSTHCHKLGAAIKPTKPGFGVKADDIGCPLVGNTSASENLKIPATYQGAPMKSHNVLAASAAVISLVIASTAHANWLTGIVKGMRGADEAAAAAKSATKTPAGTATLHEAEDAAQATKGVTSANTPAGSDPILLRHPWVSVQLSRCIANMQSKGNKDSAAGACHAKYSSCVDSRKLVHTDSQPVEVCVKAANQ
jgi:hypothetical protein